MLSSRTGTAVVLFASRTHLEDTFEPNWICTDNAALFTMDTFDKGMWDVRRLLEQWACTKAKSMDNIYIYQCSVLILAHSTGSRYLGHYAR